MSSNSLVSVEEVRALVTTDLPDTELQAVIDREERALIAHTGPHYNAETPLVEAVSGQSNSVFTSRRIATVLTVTEAWCLGDTPTTLTSAQFFVWHDQGHLQRLPNRRRWGAVVSVTYQPVDDTAERKSTLIELVRLAVERTALKSESVAGEYSYTAVDWDAARERLYQAHVFMVF